MDGEEHEFPIGKLGELGGERIEERPHHRVDAISHPTASAASDPASIRFSWSESKRENRLEHVEDEQWVEMDSDVPIDDGRIVIDPWNGRSRIDSSSVHPDSVSIFEHGIRVK